MKRKEQALNEMVLDEHTTRQTQNQALRLSGLRPPPHLVFHRAGTLEAVLVLKLQQQVHRGLAVFRLTQEATGVHLPFDGGVPVILHSIVCPVGANRGPLNSAGSMPPDRSLTFLSCVPTSVNEGST